MSNNNTGGPAFPTDTAFQGMTLRDYFAAKALQGLATDPRLGPDGEAALAYRYADAMMKARMKPRQD